MSQAVLRGPHKPAVPRANKSEPELNFTKLTPAGGRKFSAVTWRAAPARSRAPTPPSPDHARRGARAGLADQSTLKCREEYRTDPLHPLKGTQNRFEYTGPGPPNFGQPNLFNQNIKAAVSDSVLATHVRILNRTCKRERSAFTSQQIWRLSRKRMWPCSAAARPALPVGDPGGRRGQGFREARNQVHALKCISSTIIHHDYRYLKRLPVATHNPERVN